MSKPENTPLIGTDNWRYLIEAAMVETNCRGLSRRIRDAQEAVMDEIECSFQSASQFERQSMINAMNSLRELCRLVQIPESHNAKHVALFDA